MPTVKSIAAVAELDPGELLSACKGKVKTVMTYHAGKVKQGPRTGEDFSIQNIILQDLGDPSVTITAKFDGREEIPASWRGKVLNLVANAGKKGLSGLKMVEDTYKGKTTKVLKVTGSAEVTPGIDPEVAGSADDDPGQDGNRPESPQDEPGQQEPPGATQRPKHAQTGQGATKPSQGLTDEEKAALDAADVKEGKKLACRLANTWLIAYAAARRARVRLVTERKEDLTEEMFKSFVSTLCIQMFRENAHLKLPYRDFDLNGKKETKP